MSQTVGQPYYAGLVYSFEVQYLSAVSIEKAENYASLSSVTPAYLLRPVKITHQGAGYQPRTCVLTEIEIL